MSTSDQVMQEEKKQTEMHKGKEEEEEEKVTPINGDVETNGDGQDEESKSTSHPVTNEENSSPIKSSSSPKKKTSEKGPSQESPVKKKTETISESPNKKKTETISESPNKKSAKSESEASPRKSTRTPVKTKSPEKSSPASKSQSRKRKADDHNESVGVDSEPSHQPLFEAPLVVEGKRPRHSVERLTTTHQSTGPQKKVTESTGTGITLGEIEYVATLINTHKSDSLKALHRVLFNRPGTASMVKKNIRIFNGFSFDANSPEYEKKLGQLTKLSMAELKLIRSVIGVESATQKSDLVKHIIDFLMKPFDAGRRAPGSAKKAKKIRTPSKAEKSPKSTSAKKSQKKKKAGKGKDEPASENSENDEQSDTSEEVEEKEKEPAQTIAKSTDPSPTDEELETVIRQLLKDVDLESVTMKQMCKTIFDQYPEAKLEDRKSDVKTLIKKIIGESGEDN